MQSKRFAVTGGIGSGKSTVCALLKEMGYAVLSCDEISRELWNSEEYKKGLLALFPSCEKEGEIDKARLTALVFQDGEALERLNAYAHPRIMEGLLSRAETFPLCFCEVPLLFEGGYEGLFDGVIAVVREESARKNAVEGRDGVSDEEVSRRMRAQISCEELKKKRCLLVENNGTKGELEERLEAALQQLNIR